MTRLPMILAIFLVAACGQQDEAAPAVNDSSGQTAAPAAPAAEVPTLEGQWGVAAIDGKPVGAGSATASFSGGKASLAFGCVRRAWTYTQKRNVVTFASDPGGSANCEGRGTSAEQETAAVALEQASIAIFNKDGSQADLSGTGGNLTLKRR